MPFPLTFSYYVTTEILLLQFKLAKQSDKVVFHLNHDVVNIQVNTFEQNLKSFFEDYYYV